MEMNQCLCVLVNDKNVEKIKKGKMAITFFINRIRRIYSTNKIEDRAEKKLFFFFKTERERMR